MPQAAKFGPGLIVQKLHRKQADGDAILSVSANAFADTMGKSSGIRILPPPPDAYTFDQQRCVQ
jgi:hypothetical protein